MENSKGIKKIIVGITGASGSIYGKRIIEELAINNEVHIIASEQGKKVFNYEIGVDFEDFLSKIYTKNGSIYNYEPNDMFALVASGSNKYDAMVVAPCSMGTLSKIANGISDNLLIRSADVCIKEKRQLLLVPRESPLNSIHLENMLKLSKIGIDIFPPMPQFYSKPTTIEQLVDMTVGRILNIIGIESDLLYRWNNN